ncbi:hypothetical protein EO95_09410 [Methanosarcina sp. 1.H.T.1A.1]|uniref:hypothetical protein n=1 Tax=Methanosarcina sp. 1.H.T.1A.1 TaxID=1483602 RepID=UPI0006211BB3|nr:hypothetical protein [Methanosarcina sp. 1.H.T.1A.1]KKH92885.1 hypothetical protein EO95_09410 [Methanosarcina sp. 1.H.T.1A.1]
MPYITLVNEYIPDGVLQTVDEYDPYDWVYILFKAYHGSIDNYYKERGTTYDDDLKMRGFMTMLFSGIDALDKYPILNIDPAVEVLIEDTNPDVNNIKVPFPKLFINKRFKAHKGYIMGIVVEDMNQVSYQTFLQAGLSPKEAKKMVDKVRNHPDVNGEIPAMSFLYVYYSTEKIQIIMSDLDEIFDPNSDIDKEVFTVMKKAMIYAANVSNLITTNVDLDNLVNPDRDIRLIPQYKPTEDVKALTERDKRFSVIRLFGNLRRYTQEYAKEKRKHAAKDQDAVIVRGHWRHLRSPRFRNKRGQSIWIPPFIRGMDKELYSRIIHVKK